MGVFEEFRLRVFLAVVKEESFTEAARLLNVSQPTVSNHIAELEKGLGVRLFDRLRGNVVLTPEGEVFKSYADKFSGLADQASVMFSPLPSSTVSISASEELYTYYIYPLLQSFSKVHPEITFERSFFGDCDLTFAMRPSAGSPFDTDGEVIARMRVSVWAAPKKTGDITATRENNSYFDLLYQPSQAFACTKTCRLLKDYFASLL